MAVALIMVQSLALNCWFLEFVGGLLGGGLAMRLGAIAKPEMQQIPGLAAVT